MQMLKNLGTGEQPHGGGILLELRRIAEHGEVVIIEPQLDDTPVETLRALLSAPAAGENIEDSVTALVRQTIFQYYQLIDVKLLDRVIDLFAADATYLRAGQILDGKNQIAAFYKNDRKLDGKHEITGLWPQGLGATVCGTFHFKDASRASIYFFDHWVFDTSGYVASRRTFLLNGSEKIIA
jgi:hypothetical protein